MDIALCKVDLSTLKLSYSGAMRPLYLVKDGLLEEIKADKFPIGGLQEDLKKEFHLHEFQLSHGDGFFIASDGYADQFGGPQGKKFMTKRLKELLQENYKKPIDQVNNILDTTFEEWKADFEQVDDILVIGVKV
jgi:serine phosphatase RsbU (regulator of sigma subunit)